MGLAEEIAKLDLEAKEEPAPPAEEIEALEEETVEGGDEEAAPEKEEAEAKPEEPKPATPEPRAAEIKDGPIDNSAWARMRYEASEAKREADRLKAELEEMKKPKLVAPNKEENFEGYLEHEITTLKQEVAETKGRLQTKEAQEQYVAQRSQAMEEFVAIENSVKVSVPDYEDVSRHGISVLAASIRVLNPGITSKKLGEQIQEIVLAKAANAFREGKNPALALYEEAKSYGYQPKAPAAEEAPAKPAERKPDLATIAKNKLKSAGMTAGGSSGSALPTNQSMLGMTNAERSRLTPSDWERMEQEAS